MLDFSASINPLGPPPEVKQALAGFDPATYPDPDCVDLREALSSHLSLPADHILIGNGATELIHLLARAYLNRRSRCLIFSPAFGEYEASARLSGALIHHVTAAEQDGFVWNADAALQAIRRLRPHLAFLANPANPTGVYLSQETVMTIAEAMPAGSLLILDEAFVTFVDNAWDALPLLATKQVVLLRSMTKDYAIAGLRLGYLVARPAVIERLRPLQPPWSVNGAAQAAGLAALNSGSDYLVRSRSVIAEARDYLSQELMALGLRPYPSVANFVLVETGRDAAILRKKLLLRGTNVRDCTSFGLPTCIRVAVRTMPECQRLVAALQEVVAEMPYSQRSQSL